MAAIINRVSLMMEKWLTARWGSGMDYRAPRFVTLRRRAYLHVRFPSQ
jgi:hypothetical protein